MGTPASRSTDDGDKLRIDGFDVYRARGTSSCVLSGRGGLVALKLCATSMHFGSCSVCAFVEIERGGVARPVSCFFIYACGCIGLWLCHHQSSKVR